MTGIFVLAAGGTGGHLFPAQALAGELIRRGRRVVVMTDNRGRNFIGAFPGAEIESVPSAAMSGRSVLGRIAALGIIGLGVMTALRKLLKLRPRVVVGFGGYPSLPVMLAASLLRLPSILHEQNAVMGRVNRLLAPRASKIAASLPFARFAPGKGNRIVFTGNPVRPEAALLKGTPYRPPGPDGTIKLLVFGGSQGARALSQHVPAALARLSDAVRHRLSVVQQARAPDVAMVQAAYRQSGIAAEVKEFFTDLPQRMAEAHLTIARSGASTLSELTVIGRPAILIPYPHAMDDHQAANAAVLERQGAAWVVREDALEAESFASLLEVILTHPNGLTACADAARSLGRDDAAGKLADLVENLMEPGPGAQP